jgi:hypothetical protein
MTEHLPECPVQTKDSVCRCLPCICDALRACEQRITAAAVQRVEALICTDCLEHLTLGDVWATCLSCDGAWEALAAIKGDQP